MARQQTANGLSDGTILVVDDDRDVLLTAELVLKDGKKVIHTLSNPSDMPALLEEHDVRVVLLDMNFTRGFTAGDEGFYWLNKIKELSPHTQIIMATAYGEIDLAVEAIKQGAADFLVKPWDNEKLISTVNACLELKPARPQANQSQEGLSDLPGEIIGQSQLMQQVFDLIDKVAATDASVLILGENGTGKELVARAIHNQSNRKASPLVSVDLGAIAENLFESEMFGHKKGAFTDAREDRAGRFEMATGGTLFLDEIGNLSLPLQAKLLGALQSRSVSRVGSDVAVPVDIRLISATNLNAEALADESRFRRDLLYRINTVEVVLPPLRHRVEDIPLLAAHYIEIYAQQYNKPKLELDKAAITRLQNYSWPGNVRELQHALERAVIISDNAQVDFQDILVGRHPGSDSSAELNIAKLEHQAIEKAIRQYSGNLTQVAKALGMGRTTLYRKMEKYGISD